MCRGLNNIILCHPVLSHEINWFYCYTVVQLHTGGFGLHLVCLKVNALNIKSDYKVREVRIHTVTSTIVG